MIISLKKYITIEKKPHRGLMPLEWTVLGYALFTLLMVLFTYTKLESEVGIARGSDLGSCSSVFHHAGSVGRL